MQDGPERSAAEFVRALSAVLSQVAPPSQVLKTILGQAVSQTGADRGLLATIGPGGRLDYRILYRIESESLDGAAGSFSRNIFAEVVRTGRAVRLVNAMNDPRFASKESIQDLRLTSNDPPRPTWLMNSLRVAFCISLPVTSVGSIERSNLMKVVYLPKSPTMSRSASLKLVVEALLTCVSSRAANCASATAG